MTGERRLDDHGAHPRPRMTGNGSRAPHGQGQDPHRRPPGADQPESPPPGGGAPAADPPNGGPAAATAIVDQARAQAYFEAARIRKRATDDAEQARAAIIEQARGEARQEAERLLEEARAEATRAKDAALEESRNQAYYEGARLREQAAAEAAQLLAEAREAAFAGTEAARAEADRIREMAISEGQRVKQAIVEHAREAAESESARLREEAVLDAEEAKAAIVEQARRDAERIREEAEQQRRLVLDRAEEEAVRVHLEAAASVGDVPEGEPGLLCARDIGTRDFPEARRGYDPESVRTWLKVVEASYGLLEEELDRARREWERSLEILEVTRLYLNSVGLWGGSLHKGLERQLDAVRAAWQQSSQALSASKLADAGLDLPALLVRASQLEARLDRRLYGYSATQVQHLLDELTTELARLEHQVGALRAENEGLRARLQAQVSRPGAERLAVLELLPPDALAPKSLGAGSSNGASPGHDEMAG